MRDGKEVMLRPGQKAGSFTDSSFSWPEIGTGLASERIRQGFDTTVSRQNKGKPLPLT
jgi:hypothetical protein